MLNCIFFENSNTESFGILKQEILCMPNTYDTKPLLLLYSKLSSNKIISEYISHSNFIEYLNVLLHTLDLLDENVTIESRFISNWYYFVLKDNNKPNEIMPFSQGLAHVTTFLSMLYCVPKNSTVIIEHPEQYLHLNSQHLLSTLLFALADENNLNVIVSSFSERLFRGIQRNIALEVYSKDKVNLMYFNNQKELKPITLNEYGETLNYPNGLFGYEMQEVAITHKAILNRKFSDRK